MAREAEAGCVSMLLFCCSCFTTGEVQLVKNWIIHFSAPCIFWEGFCYFSTLTISSEGPTTPVKLFPAECLTVRSWYLCICTPTCVHICLTLNANKGQLTTSSQFGVKFSHSLGKCNFESNSVSEWISVFTVASRLTCGFAFKANAPLVSPHSFMDQTYTLCCIIYQAQAPPHCLQLGSNRNTGRNEYRCRDEVRRKKKNLLMRLFILVADLLCEPRNKETPSLTFKFVAICNSHGHKLFSRFMQVIFLRWKNIIRWEYS